MSGESNYLTADNSLRSWFFTTDHKRVAILYFAGITLFFFVGGAAATAIRLELVTPASLGVVTFRRAGSPGEPAAVVDRRNERIVSSLARFSYKPAAPDGRARRTARSSSSCRSNGSSGRWRMRTLSSVMQARAASSTR